MNGRDASGFRLENGAAELTRHFTDVRLEQYPDALAITEAAPLIAYILSTTRVRERFSTEGEDGVRAEVTAYVEHELAQQGTIHIPKEIGMFIARRDDSVARRCATVTLVTMTHKEPTHSDQARRPK